MLFVNMAGHSHAANVRHKKNANDAKKAKLFTKIQRLIYIAAKEGSPDPELNSKLKVAIFEARAMNMSKDKIDSAIKKASGAGEAENYESIRYNGYGNGGIGIIVETLTDNKNRTAGEVRSIFSKFGGSLGETGSVEFMFDRVGIIEYQSKGKSFDEILEASIELNANDVQEEDGLFFIEASFELTNSVSEGLRIKFGDPENVSIIWKPQNKIQIDDSKKESFEKFIDAIEDLDDVQNVFHNCDI